MKKIALLLLSAILLTSFLGISSFAAVPSDSLIQPLWTNTLSLGNTFSFHDGTQGVAELTVTGQFGVNKIEGEITIYRQVDSDWVSVASGSDTANAQTFDLSVPVTGVSGGYYKAEFEINVYKNGVCETITRTKYANCP